MSVPEQPLKIDLGGEGVKALLDNLQLSEVSPGQGAGDMISAACIVMAHLGASEYSQMQLFLSAMSAGKRQVAAQQAHLEERERIRAEVKAEMENEDRNDEDAEDT